MICWIQEQITTLHILKLPRYWQILSRWELYIDRVKASFEVKSNLKQFFETKITPDLNNRARMS